MSDGSNPQPREGLTPATAAALQGFGQAMLSLFEPLGGFDFSRIAHEALRTPPDFSGSDWDPCINP